MKTRRTPDSESSWSRNGPTDNLSEVKLGTWVGGETEARVRRGLGLIVVGLGLEPKPLDSQSSAPSIHLQGHGGRGQAVCRGLGVRMA